MYTTTVKNLLVHPLRASADSGSAMCAMAAATNDTFKLTALLLQSAIAPGFCQLMWCGYHYADFHGKTKKKKSQKEVG